MDSKQERHLAKHGRHEILSSNIGPWADSVAELDESLVVEETSKSHKDDTSTTQQAMHILEPDIEEEKWERVNERKISHMLPPRPARGSLAIDVR